MCVASLAAVVKPFNYLLGHLEEQNFKQVHILVALEESSNYSKICYWEPSMDPTTEVFFLLRNPNEVKEYIKEDKNIKYSVKYLTGSLYYYDENAKLQYTDSFDYWLNANNALENEHGTNPSEYLYCTLVKVDGKLLCKECKVFEH